MEGRITRPFPTVPTTVLAAHSIRLDTMFTELARHAALNKGEYIKAAERYARLALKAQSNSTNMQGAGTPNQVHLSPVLALSPDG